MRRNGARLVAAVLLPAVLLLVAGVSAQPQRADAPIMINDLACPANIITLESGSDLKDYQAVNTTVVLQPGNYSMTDAVQVVEANAVVCYVGNGTTREDVTVFQTQASGSFRATGTGTLGLKGLVLSGPVGGALFSGGAIDAQSGGSLSVEDVTLQEIRRAFPILLLEPRDITFSNTRFQGVSGSQGVLGCGGSSSNLRMHEVRCLFFKRQGAHPYAICRGSHQNPNSQR